MGKSYVEGVSLLEILIWVSPNKSGIFIPFCLQSQNSTSYQNLNFFLHGNDKTKQSSYYLNLFHESIYFPHPGLNVSPQHFQSRGFFLVSTDARNSPSTCGDLPMWYIYNIARQSSFSYHLLECQKHFIQYSNMTSRIRYTNKGIFE